MSSPTITDIRDALTPLLPGHVYHYWANGEHSQKYICFMENAEANAQWSDYGRTLRTLNGTVDLFTKQEYDPLFNAVEDALIGIGCALKLNSVQFEHETGYIHYEWYIEFYG